MPSQLAERADLERATDLFRLFREQPTSEIARTARAGMNAAIPPNERLQNLFTPAPLGDVELAALVDVE